jgi:hypothetical protein
MIVVKDRMTIVVTEVTETRSEWERISTTWQLPCGCIGADIWSSREKMQSTCTACDRGWHTMDSPKSHGYCAMLDGQPQGIPTLVLKPEWEVAGTA